MTAAYGLQRHKEIELITIKNINTESIINR